MALAVVVMLVVGGLAVVTGLAVAERRSDDAARTELAEALSRGNASAAVRAVDGHPELLTTERTVRLGDESVTEVGAAGFTVVEVDLEEGTEYSVASDGDPVLFAPGGDDAEALPRSFVAEESGTYAVALVGDAGDEVSVRITPVRLVPIETSEVVEDEVAPGEIVDLAFDVQTDEHYYVKTFEGPGLELTFLDEEGEEIVTYLDQDGDERFVAESDGTVRARIEGESVTANGGFELDVTWVATHSVSYGESGDDAYLATDVEADAVTPVFDEERAAFTVCIWIRTGVTVSLDVTPRTAGTTWDLFTYDGADVPVSQASDTFTEVTTRTVTLDPPAEDTTVCLDLVPHEKGQEGVGTGVEVAIGAAT